MFKALSFFLGLVFSSLNYALDLPRHTAFPPYPPVWGYDITDFPAIKNGCAAIDAYRMPDGDIWFLIDYAYQYKDPRQGVLGSRVNEEFVLLKFFKNEQTKLDLPERKAFLKLAVDKKLSKLDSIVSFSDGGTLKMHFEPSPTLCRIPQFLGSYGIRTDANQYEKKYSILGVTPHVAIFEDKSFCETKGAPFFYQRLYALSVLIDLGDDTFLAYSGNSPLILRFDKDLNTKFKAEHPVLTKHSDMIFRNFFVVDYSVIEDLKNKNIRKKEVPFNQTVHDELLLYFEKKYQSENSTSYKKG